MAALSNGFKHRHSKTDSSLESFLEPKNAKHFPALSVLFHSEAERLNFFGPLSPTKTRLLKLSRWAPAGQLLPLRTPRFMPSVFLTGFKGLVHPKNKKNTQALSARLCADWKVQMFQELHSNSPEQLKQPETWNGSIRLQKPRDAKSTWKDVIYILNMRPSSCTHFGRGARSLPSALQPQGRFRLIKVCK